MFKSVYDNIEYGKTFIIRKCRGMLLTMVLIGKVMGSKKLTSSIKQPHNGQKGVK